MSAITLSLRPSLTDELMDVCGLVFDEPHFSYIKNNEEPVSIELTPGFFHAIKDREYDPDMDYRLMISGDISIANPSLLFGAQGIVPLNSTIGLVIRWASNQSRKRGNIFVGDIVCDSGPQKLHYEHVFPSRFFRGVVDFSLILYVKKSGTLSTGEYKLYNNVGETIGETEKFKLMIDGNSPDLNIITVEKPNEPLWWISSETVDPFSDYFDAKALTIYINLKHKDSKYINKNSRSYVASLLDEIIASAMTLFVNNLRSSHTNIKWENLTCTDDHEPALPGSIMENLKNFHDELGMDFSNPIETAKSFRKFLDK